MRSICRKFRLLAPHLAAYAEMRLLGVEARMADGTDLAGNPRLRDGKADIGCYQCWIMPVGSALSIR